MPTNAPDDPLHVGLIYGGRSPEHEVSIDSAHNVFAALSERYRVTPLRIDRDGRWHVKRQSFLDAVTDGPPEQDQ
ncbi:MAG: hypothetical protein BRD29_00260 [Bacteroidetes bacterium QH_2_67_10]|nr:MAG: hypothetical protein BRD29_00260 [Bacteroidetes bacterium QH_2_67_10]